MLIFNDLLVDTQPGGRLEKLEKVESSEAEKLKSIYPNLPEDYLSFLEEVGNGEIGNAAYMIYNGVLSPDEIYDETMAKSLSDILIFGDDMQGFCSGFDVEHGWLVVEIDPSDMSYRKTFDCFSDFIRDKLRMI